MKVALVHDWLVQNRGGEKVLLELSKIFPEAPIYTLFHDRGNIAADFGSRTIIAHKKLAKFNKFRKLLLPILPLCIESLDLGDYDLIISSSSCVAKGVIPSPNAKHISYVHSPMRYIWDQQREYFKKYQKIPIIYEFLQWQASRLRRWDISSSHLVDSFIVNSSFVSERVKRYYRRDSKVIYPPVDIDFFRKSRELDNREDYFLAAGALVAYKRFDLAIAACERLGKRLIVAGSGPMERSLRRLAGKHTEFIIQPSNQDLLSLLQGAKVLLFPGVEDFGVIAVEAMACGTPVVAYRHGGAVDFIEEGKSGFFFEDLTEESLSGVLAENNFADLDASIVSSCTNRFHREIFKSKVLQEVEAVLGSK